MVSAGPADQGPAAVAMRDALGKRSLFSEVLCQPSAAIYLGSIPLHAKHCKNAKAYNWHSCTASLCCQHIPECGQSALRCFFSYGRLHSTAIKTQLDPKKHPKY